MSSINGPHDSLNLPRTPLRNAMRRCMEAVGRLVFGQQVQIVAKSELDRLHQLGYRDILLKAEEAGDTEFLRSELAKHQLTADDLKRIRQHRVPIEQWPNTPDDLLEPEGAAPPQAPSGAH